MNKLYFGIPLVGVVAFFFYAMSVKEEYKAKEAEKERQEQEARLAKLEEDRANQLRAVEEARKAAEIRKKEQEARKAKDEAERAQREEELLARERARTEQDRLRAEVRTLKEDLEREQAKLQEAVDRKKAFEAEKRFLAVYTEQARANKDRFLELVSKIEESEKAKERLAAMTKK